MTRQFAFGKNEVQDTCCPSITAYDIDANEFAATGRFARGFVPQYDKVLCGETGLDYGLVDETHAKEVWTIAYHKGLIILQETKDALGSCEDEEEVDSTEELISNYQSAERDHKTIAQILGWGEMSI